MAECPNCKIEYDLRDEQYDDNREETRVSVGCSVCGYTENWTE